MNEILRIILDPVLHYLARELLADVSKTNIYTLYIKQTTTDLSLMNFVRTCKSTWDKHQLLMKPTRVLVDDLRQTCVYYGLIKHGLCESSRIVRSRLGNQFVFNVINYWFGLANTYKPIISYSLFDNTTVVTVRVGNNSMGFDVDYHSVADLTELTEIVRNIGPADLRLRHYNIADPDNHCIQNVVWPLEKDDQYYVEMEEKARQIYTDYLDDFQNYK